MRHFALCLLVALFSCCIQHVQAARSISYDTSSKTPLPSIPFIFTARAKVVPSTDKPHVQSTEGIFTYDTFKQRTRYDFEVNGRKRSSVKLFTTKNSVQYDLVFKSDGSSVESCSMKVHADHPFYPLVPYPIAKFIGKDRIGEEGKRTYIFGIRSGLKNGNMDYWISNRTSSSNDQKTIYTLDRFMFSSTMHPSLNAKWEFTDVKPLSFTKDAIFEVWKAFPSACPPPPEEIIRPSVVSIKGFVKNALDTSQVLPNIQVKMKYPVHDYKDVDKDDPWVETSVFTNAIGLFSFESIPRGKKVFLEINDPKYGASPIKKTVQADSDILSNTFADFHLLPTNPQAPASYHEGPFRVVLSWNNMPLDLDGFIHFKSLQNNKGTIGYTWKQFSDSFFTAKLSQDVTNGFGPEVISYKPLMWKEDTTMTYYVKRSRGGLPPQPSNTFPAEVLGNFAQSGVTVSVYSEKALIATYTIKSNDAEALKEENGYWVVFSHTGKSGLTEINKVTSNINRHI